MRIALHHFAVMVCGFFVKRLFQFVAQHAAHHGAAPSTVPAKPAATRVEMTRNPATNALAHLVTRWTITLGGTGASELTVHLVKTAARIRKCGECSGTVPVVYLYGYCSIPGYYVVCQSTIIPRVMHSTYQMVLSYL